MKPGRPETVNFAVEPGVLVRGVVRDRANKPEHIGILVRYGVRDQWDRAFERIFVGTDAQGRFEVRVLAGWIALERNITGSDKQQDGDVPKTNRYVPPGKSFDLGAVNLPEGVLGRDQPPQQRSKAVSEPTSLPAGTVPAAPCRRRVSRDRSFSSEKLQKNLDNANASCHSRGDVQEWHALLGVLTASSLFRPR